MRVPKVCSTGVHPRDWSVTVTLVRNLLPVSSVLVEDGPPDLFEGPLHYELDSEIQTHLKFVSSTRLRREVRLFRLPSLSPSPFLLPTLAR